MYFQTSDNKIEISRQTVSVSKITVINKALPKVSTWLL